MPAAPAAICRRCRHPGCTTRLPIIEFVLRGPARPTRTEMLSRRSFLAAAAFGGVRLLRGASQPLFEEVTPAGSRIHWIHENARSPMRYMPEAFGPGCAFLDYDND